MIVNYWLCHDSSGEKIDKIDLIQLQQLFSKINQSEIESWYIWYSALSQWSKVVDTPEIYSLYKQINEEIKEEPSPPPFEAPKVPPPPLFLKEEPQPELIVINSETYANDKVILVQKNDSQPEEKRKHQRFFKRFKVLIESSNHIYRSFTKDISIGGISLEHGLPEKMVNTECSVYITYVDNKDTIMIKAKPIIRADKNYKFFSFNDLEDSYKKKLEEWLSNKI